MATLRYDPVTDWRLCDRVKPAALRDVLRRLLWRSGDWLGLLWLLWLAWLAWHWMAMRTKRTDKDGPS